MSKYKRLVCWTKSGITWLHGVPYFTPGHDYYQVYESEDCEVLYCDRCWHISTGFNFSPQDKINEIKSNRELEKE